MKTGRNDPCPCGSGKKYKKCCIDSIGNTHFPETFGKRDRMKSDDIIPVDAVMDYGPACSDNAFFEANDVHDISSARLLYSIILNPHVEILAHMAVRQVLSRGEDEADCIRKADNVETLIDIMKSKPDPINHALLMERLITEKGHAVPFILSELMEPQNDSFVELAVRILHRAGGNHSNEIIKIIRSGNNKRAYVVSTLCVLLGFYDNDESEKLLWDYYHYMKEKYPLETYSDGPLLGLIEMRERKKESALLN
jgi:hypothetical protein